MRNRLSPTGRPAGLLFLAAAWLTPLSVWSQATAPTPVLTSLHPLGGKPGTTVEVSFKGTDLDGPAGLHFSPALAATTAPALNAKGQPEPNKLLLKLPAEAAAGTYEIRFQGTYGVSNPRVFQISPAAVIESPGTNSKATSALRVTPDSAIQGVFKTAAPHWFEFEAKAGQRLLAVFDGADFAVRTRLVGSLIDPKGREIARLRDGMLDATPTAGGLHRLKIHDLMFGAGDDYAYRLTLTTGPIVWAAQTNPETASEVYGWNLPGSQVVQGLRVSAGSPLESVSVEPAALASLTAASALPPLPLPPGMRAHEAPPAPAPIEIGQTIGGWFPAGGESCAFDLLFKSGDRFAVEVTSAYTGFPTDPVLLVENVKKDAAGAETLAAQAEVNDAPALVPAPAVRPSLLDPVYAFEAKADGHFRLSVSDPLNAANGRRYPFALRITPLAQADLSGATASHPILPPAAPTGPIQLGSANVWQNGIQVVEVSLPRRHALSPAVELKTGDLPPGLTSLGGFIGKGQRLGYLAIQAAAEAKAGTATLAMLPRTAHLNWAVRDSNREILLTLPGRSPVLGVVPQPAPALVRVGAGAVLEVEAGGKLDIPVKASRNAAFNDALTLKVMGLVDAAKAPVVTLPAKATDGKLTLDTKTLALAPGEYGFILQGPAKMPLRRNAEELAKAELAAQTAAAAQAQAQKEADAANAAVKALPPENTEALQSAQARVKTAAAALATAVKNKAAAEKAAKDLAAKSPPKDATFVVYSNPVRLLVKEASKK